MSGGEKSESGAGDAKMPEGTSHDALADVAAQVAALTLPVAENAGSEAPRLRHTRFEMGVVGKVAAYYAGDELQPNEVRLLRTILETAHAAGAVHPVLLPGEMLEQWLLGAVTNEASQYTRAALFRLSEIAVEFVIESGVPRSKVVQTQRGAMFRRVELFETKRRSTQSTITLCNVEVDPSVAAFMIDGRSPFSGERAPATIP